MSATDPATCTSDRSARMHPVLPKVETVTAKDARAWTVSGTASGVVGMPPESMNPTARLQLPTSTGADSRAQPTATPRATTGVRDFRNARILKTLRKYGAAV